MIFLNKNKNNRTPKDFRPITLVKGWCKIAELLFINRIEYRLDQLKFFNKSQYGFVKGLSTHHAISKLISDIKTREKSNKFNLLISFDVSGAFDNITWQIIRKNLEKSNIEHKYVRAAETILIDRKIMINNNDKLYNCSKGCPQGGCASPFLMESRDEQFTK
jgi:hypothetical protein